jgi:hypothetical protein
MGEAELTRAGRRAGRSGSMPRAIARAKRSAGAAVLLVLPLLAVFVWEAPRSAALSVPSTKVPSVTVPSVTVPSVTVPSVTVPATPVTPPVSTPKVSTPSVSTPAVSTRSGAVPSTHSTGGSVVRSATASAAGTAPWPSSVSGAVYEVAPTVDRSLGDHSSATFGHAASSRSSPAAARRARQAARRQKQLRRLVLRLRGCLAELSPQAARTLELRTGVGMRHQHTGPQVARIMHVSQAREHRVEQAAVVALRNVSKYGCGSSSRAALAAGAASSSGMFVGTQAALGPFSQTSSGAPSSSGPPNGPAESSPDVHGPGRTHHAGGGIPAPFTALAGPSIFDRLFDLLILLGLMAAFFVAYVARRTIDARRNPRPVTAEQPDPDEPAPLAGHSASRRQD